MNSIQKLDYGLLEMNKEAIENLVSNQIELIENGEIDPINALVFSHKLLEFAKQLQASIKPHVSGVKGEYNGLRLSEVKTNSKFNYYECGDVKYNNLIESLEQAKNAVSEREKFLKTIKENTISGDPETGETWEIKPPVNTFSISTKIEWL